MPLFLFLLIMPVQLIANPAEIRVYNVYCDPSDLAVIHANPHEDIYIPCEFEYDGNVWQDVRLRLRGDSSRDYPKKSYKINFDRDDRFGLRDKINLNSEWLDPSFSKEYLSYSAYARAGLPASRCWFARLYINGEYYGLYLDVEQVDDISLDRMGFPDGASLYKAARDGAQLKPTESVEELWEKETNTETGFYDLQALIEWIDNVPDQEFYQDLGSMFDRPLLARHMAINAIICNSSTYYHNYYLLHDLEQGGQWTILPWDMDRTNSPWGSHSNHPEYFRTTSGVLEDTNPLIVRSWQDDAMRRDVFENIDGLVDSLLTPAWYQEIAEHLDTLLIAAIDEDPNKQYTVEDFHASLAEIPGRMGGRGEYLKAADEFVPFPFDLHAATARNDSLFLSWDASSTRDGTPINYRVEIDTIFNFSTSQSIAVGHDTTLVVTGLPPGLWYWNVYASVPGWPDISSFRVFRTVEVSDTETYPEPVISQSTTWSEAQSPYRIEGHVRIAEGARVSVEPGVRIQMGRDSQLEIEGILEASGSIASNVKVESDGMTTLLVSGGSAQLKMTNTSMAGSVRIIADREASIQLSNFQWNSTDGSIKATDASLFLDSCSIRSNQSTFIDATSSSVSLQRTTIRQQSAESFVIRYSGSGTDSLILDECEFYTFAGNGIELAGTPSTTLLDRIILRAEQGERGLVARPSLDTLRIWNLQVEGFTQGVVVDQYLSRLELMNALLLHNVTALSGSPQSHGYAFVRNVVFWDNETDWDIPADRINLGWSFVHEDSLASGTRLVTGAEPGFVDGWNGNYYPLPDAPLIDSGFGSGVSLHDGAGHPRRDIAAVPNSGAGSIGYVDIGLYENQGGLTPPPTEYLPPPGEGVPLFGYPNPFNGTVRVLYDVEKLSDVELTIFNILGRRVYHNTLHNRSAGRYELVWQGVSDEGVPLASGMYFLQVRQAGKLRTLRLLLVR